MHTGTLQTRNHFCVSGRFFRILIQLAFYLMQNIAMFMRYAALRRISLAVCRRIADNQFKLVNVSANSKQNSKIFLGKNHGSRGR
jgi:hypothetical protein